MDLQDLEGMHREKRLGLVDQEDMNPKRNLVSEISALQATGGTQKFPGSFTSPNPCILEDAQPLRVPGKQFQQKQEDKGKSAYPSQFSGAHNGATVLDSQRDATRNMQVCNMGATPEHENPGFAMLGSCVSKSVSRPVKAGIKLFGVTLTDTSTSEQERRTCKSSKETHEDQYRHQRNPSRSRTKVFKQGNGIGRSVDLTKFEGYPELIGELEVLFNLEGQLRDCSKGWSVAYSDFEGDIILLGDEPWKEFCGLVAKIFIYKSNQEVKKSTIGAQA